MVPTSRRRMMNVDRWVISRVNCFRTKIDLFTTLKQLFKNSARILLCMYLLSDVTVTWDIGLRALTSVDRCLALVLGDELVT